jgi:hypothetical protein
MRVEHEYERRGALAYLAAWDVHHARLFGRCEASTGIEPFDRLVAQVMTAKPYASAERVFWIVDNGSSHRGQASIQRLEGAYANLRLIHLRSTPPGSTRSRSTSPSSSARSCPPTTSPTWSRLPSGYSASSAATSRPQRRSTGASPAPTWTGSHGGWTSFPRPPKPPTQRQGPTGPPGRRHERQHRAAEESR